MHFTETDKVKLEVIVIDSNSLESANATTLKAIIKNIEAGKGYEPVEVKHDLDHDTYTLIDGLETFMACWWLEHERVKVEISF